MAVCRTYSKGERDLGRSSGSGEGMISMFVRPSWELKFSPELLMDWVESKIPARAIVSVAEMRRRECIVCPGGPLGLGVRGAAERVGVRVWEGWALWPFRRRMVEALLARGRTSCLPSRLQLTLTDESFASEHKELATSATVFFHFDVGAGELIDRRSSIR